MSRVLYKTPVNNTTMPSEAKYACISWHNDVWLCALVMDKGNSMVGPHPNGRSCGRHEKVFADGRGKDPGLLSYISLSKALEPIS